jgi:Kef-type K+ transport system membrane component KefB
LGILMNTRGLMELVILNIGLDIGVISPALFSMMVLMALVTTFMTTPLLEAVYPMHLIREETTELSPEEVSAYEPV